MAEIRVEEKTKRSLPNWLLILIAITIGLVAWWYVATQT